MRKNVLVFVAVVLGAVCFNTAMSQPVAPTVTVEEGFKTAQAAIVSFKQTQESKAPAMRSEQGKITKVSDDGWRFYSCTFSYSQQDCERVCGDMSPPNVKDSRCEQRIRCTGSSGNSWACMVKVR